jgi:hypothetical protein
LLRRFLKSESEIREERFWPHVRREVEKACLGKRFSEVHYKETDAVRPDDLHGKVETCLRNFLASERYGWIRETAMPGKGKWVIEPPGYGEARLDGLKVYCKVDFLFPVDGALYILDWKTGKPQQEKHRKQLIGYAAWASYHYDKPAADITPTIAYLQPAYEEVGVTVTDEDVHAFAEQIKRETGEMYVLCTDIGENVPKAKDAFAMTANDAICRHCFYRELCGKG